MCNYCGCREFPLIGRLTAEHTAIEETAGTLRRAVANGAAADALRLLDDLLALLLRTPPPKRRPVRRTARLAETVDALCAEHDHIHGVLTGVDLSAPDWPAVLAALDRLRRHIDNEEHGLFPAAVITLPIPAWDRITPPGQPASVT